MLIIVSCSTTKHVPNGEYLLDKVKNKYGSKRYNQKMNFQDI